MVVMPRSFKDGWWAAMRIAKTSYLNNQALYEIYFESILAHIMP
jgi:hypothetical protein